MYLERAKVTNFRGIRRLSVDFESDSTFLIGENQWGKTSLLRVLWMLLGQGEELCQFDKSDLYVPVKIEKTREFPHEDLVEKVSNRKSLNFDETYREKYRKGEIEYSCENCANPACDGREPFIDKGSEDCADFDAKIKTDVGSDVLSSDAVGPDDVSLDEDSVNKKAGNFFDELDSYIENNDPLSDFDKEDVFNTGDGKIRVDLYFRESIPNAEADTCEELKPFWNYSEDGFYRIHWQVIGKFDEDKKEFVTYHSLILKKQQNNLPFEKVKKAIFKLIALNPVFRLRDSRMEKSSGFESISQDRIKTILDMMSEEPALSGDSVKMFADTFGTFLDKYFSEYANSDIDRQKIISRSRNISDIVKSPISLESISNIKQTLTTPGFNKSKALLSYIAAAILLNKGNRKIDPTGRPILILEDIESRFHPSMLLSFWSLLAITDVQKIVTTNSGDLLSAVSLESLRRLQKKHYDTRCYKIDSSMLSYEDLRKIAFHIRINRPMVLFARSWILVEGETEVWILTQIASILGISLACEGIRIIEYAQCGLKPLIKIAAQLGINYHVLTDGDDAGKKYAEVTMSFLSKKNRETHLTVLPQRDIEHYLYTQGYAKDFKIAAGLSGNNQLRKGFDMDKVIELAIKRKSKPGLALVLVDAIQKKGIEGVPLVFANLLQEVRSMDNDNFI